MSERKVKKARAVREKSPKLAEKVRSGEMTLKDAEKEVNIPER